MKFLQRTDTADLAASFTSAPIHLETMEGYSICASLVDTTPGTGDTFVAANVNTSTETVTISDASDYWTGLKVRLTTSGALPAGLATATDYYIIAVSATTIRFASSLVNALAGTPIDLTTTGSGTQTIVIQDALTGTIKLQASNNAFADNTGNQLDPNAVWVDIPGSSIAVTTTATQFWNVSDVYYKSARIVWTHTVNGGSYTAYIYAKSVY